MIAIRPKPWTRHHAHRMYHLSFAMCFSFVAITVLWGSTLSWWQAQADQLSLSGDVSLSATVQQINPGPAVALGRGSSAPPGTSPGPEVPANPLPQPQLTSPSASVEPEASALNSKKLVTLPSGKKTWVYVYTNQYPQFSGRTNIPNALIFLEIHSAITIRATTTADKNGNWQWASPVPIPSGFHKLAIIAQDPNDSRIMAAAVMNFFIQPPANGIIAFPSPNVLEPAPGNQGNLFDVFVKIPSRFKQFAPGEELIAQVKLINFGSPGTPVDTPVRYTIEDSNHKVIMESQDTVAVATQLSIVKTFFTSNSLPEGTYTLIVRVPTKDAIALASDTFELKGGPVLALSENVRVDFTLVFQALLALFFLFVIISYFEYNKAVNLSLVIKRASEQDLKKL